MPLVGISRRRPLLALLLGAAVLGAATPAGGATPPHDRPVARGLVPGRVTAIGDSVMLDYAPDLERDVPHVVVDATVGEQWVTGVAVAEQLRAEGELGAEVIIGLGTNGPISMANFNAMRQALAGATRIVFVTVHVDRPWQSEVNAVLAAGVRATPNARLADWYRLSALHPGWFYSDGTHLPIGGVGAQACAALVSHALEARTPAPAERGQGR